MENNVEQAKENLDLKALDAAACSGVESELRSHAVGAAILDMWAVGKKHDLSYAEIITACVLTLRQVERKTGEQVMTHVVRIWNKLCDQPNAKLCDPESSTDQKHS